MSTPLQSAPAIATIDQNNFLTINWTPFLVNGGYSIYKDWNIFLGTPQTNFPGTIQLINGKKPTGLEFSGSTVDSRIFQEQLAHADYGLNMQAESADSNSPPIFTNSQKWNNSDQLFAFPSPLQASDVTLDNTTLLLGQTVTVTLANSYPETSAGAGFWQVFWPDNTTTGPLPLSTRSAAKSFTVPGSFDIVVKTWNDFSSANPPVKLYRSLSVPIFVIDQQFNPQAAAQGSLTGTLGFGGSQQFEIVDASASTVTPQPFAVVARALARDIVTNELKLMVMTSRFSNASSELGTMALDVFPLEGRPKAKELIVPINILTVTPQTSSVPVKITTNTLPNVIVGKSMPQFKMTATGGFTPYGWSNDGSLPPGLQMSVDGTISGIPTSLGTFNVNFAAVDSSNPAFIAEVTLPMTVQTDLAIPTPATGAGAPPVAKVGTAYNFQLLQSGGLAPYSWEIAAGAFPVGITIDPTSGVLEGIPCSYNSTSDFSKTFSATVQVTDAIGAKASKTFTMQLTPATLAFGPVDQAVIYCSQDFKLAVPVYGGRSPYTLTSYLDDGASSPAATHDFVDGQVEVNLDIPTTQVGVHSFGLTVEDSNSTSASATFNYKVNQEISDVRMKNSSFNHYWGSGDNTEISVGIIGSLAGFTINPRTLTTDNGLSAIINPTVPDAEVTGPPVTFRNSEVRFPIQVIQGANPVAQISRAYTLLTHNDAGETGDVGTIGTFARPYIVGDFVGLNPRKPYYNSPDIASFSPTPNSPPIDLTARVQAGSSLPPGLSLDANTGLIYGTVVGLATGNSIIEYVDSLGLIHGTITITWTIVSSNFALIDSIIDDQQIGSPFNGATALNAPTGVVLDGASLFAGALPAGLVVGIDGPGSNVTLTGTPTEAGYFDAWIQASSNGRHGYIHHRLSVDYIKPLVILTTSLPAISKQAYSTNLQGFGGIPPYTWSADVFPGGSGTGVFAGLSLVTNGDGSATVSGTLNSFPASSPTDLGNITFKLTDTRGAGSAVTLPLDLVYNNTLRIITPNVALIPADTSPYSFAMQAAGGVPPYFWQAASSPALPTGITFDATAPTSPAEEPAGGKFSGATSVSGYNQTLAITVTDSSSGSASGNFVIKTGTPALTIDTTGVGQIPRGQPYNGTLIIDGPFVAPITWQVSPTSTDPNTLPSGLVLNADASTQGVHAIISGTYSGSTLTGYLVRIVAVDATGQTAFALLSLNTIANSVAVTTTSLPPATIGGSYSQQLTATGGVPPYSWASTPTFPFHGLSLSSGGLITGSATDLFDQVFAFTVTDSIGNTSPATNLELFSQAAGLVINTTQTQLNANQPISGRTYLFTLSAGGDSNTPYAWSISPLSANQLPTGLTLDASTGNISGNTSLSGFSKAITFRVTDNIGAFVDKTLTLTVSSGLTLKSGIDFVNSLNTGVLGYIDAGTPDSINPRPNLSFYVIATGVVSTSPSQIQVTIGTSNISAVVESVSGGTAKIRLSGTGFDVANPGTYNLSVSVTDSGVNTNASFTWVVYADGVLRLAAANSFPSQLTS